jgi:hypothetical protein
MNANQQSAVERILTEYAADFGAKAAREAALYAGRAVKDGSRITMNGTRHLYVATVRKGDAPAIKINIEANSRTQAGLICRKLGFEVCDMYMEG